jgi:Flp pilus assembly protein TadD
LFYVPVTYTIWGAAAWAAHPTAPPGLPFNPAFFYAINLIAHAADRCSLNRAELIESGDGLAAQKFYTLAAACYRRALALGPPQARLYSRLAAALAQDPNTRSEAEQPCREALRLDPNDATARQTLQELARDVH